MKRLIQFMAMVAMTAVVATPCHADPTAGAKTGSFEITFNEPSPLSKMDSIKKTLHLVGEVPNYDLAKESFWVYVPAAYDPKKPVGLLVLVNYKASIALPDAILPQLADANMAMIVAKDLPEHPTQRVALALDAAYNMQQQYQVDRRRVYVMGGAERPDANGTQPLIAERLGLCYPEVFTGTISFGVNTWWKVKASNGGFYPARIAPPDAAALTLAKSHPLVIAPPNPDEFSQLAAQAFARNGFGHVKYVPINLEQIHYPKYTTDWLPDMIKFLDQSTSGLKLPSTTMKAAPTPPR